MFWVHAWVRLMCVNMRHPAPQVARSVRAIASSSNSRAHFLLCNHLCGGSILAALSVNNPMLQVVKGLQELEVKNLDDAASYMHKAKSRIQIQNTLCNSDSSRRCRIHTFQIPNSIPPLAVG